MLYFKYSSITRQGQKRRGMIAASSAHEVLHRLEARGEYLLHCRKSAAIWRYLRKINKDHLEEICIHFKEMSQAGVPLLNTLDSIKQSYPSVQFKNIFEDIYYLVENGMSLSEAMSHFPEVFNQVFLGVIKAAEISGELITAFDQLSTLLSAQRNFKLKIVQSLRYPLLLLGMIFLLISILSIFVIPQVKTLIVSFGQVLPLSTRL